MLTKNCFYGLAAVLISVCSCSSVLSTKAPSQVTEETVNASKQVIYSSAIQVLRKSGFKMAFADLELGRVSTRPKVMVLSREDCDCSNTKISSRDDGLNVSYLVLVKQGSFSLKCFIQGQSKTQEQGADSECVSSGRLESDMIRKIKDAASDNAKSGQ